MANKTKVVFICEDKDCHKAFVAEQGSRRRFCDDCLAKRIIDGLGKSGRPKKEVKK